MLLPFTPFRTSMLLLVLFQMLFSHTSAAIVSNLPRFNFHTGTVESSDLGQYNILKCEGGVTSADPSSPRICSFNKEDDGMIAYFGGAGFSSVLGLLAAVFLIFGTFVYLVYKLIKCCCCCSKEVPEDQVKTRDGLFLGPAVSFFVCLVMIVTCFCVSTFKGNYAITENTSNNEEYNLANSLFGLKTMVHTFEPSVTYSILSSTSDVLRPALIATNETLNEAVSIHELIEAFQLLNVTVPKLPDADAVLIILNTTKTIVYNSSAHMDLILVNLDDIDLLVDGISNSTRALYNQTLNLTSINDDISETISELNASIITTLAFLDEIVGDDGLVVGGVADLKAIQRVEDGGLLPNTDVFLDASMGTTGSTSRLISGVMNGNSAEITLMNGKLLAIDQNMTALPNYTLTANQLVYLNNSINDALSSTGLLANLTSHMEDLDASIKGPIPILMDILVSISSFQGNLDSLTVEMADTLRVLKIILPLIETLLPQFELLEDEVTKLYAAEDLFPILDIMVDQFLGINETLFVLTKPFNEALDNIHDVNATLQDFLNNGTLSEILTQVQDSNETVTDALAKAAEEVINLEEFQDVLQDSINDYNISDINETITDAIGLLQDINFNETYQKLLEFEQSLAKVRIDADFVNSLYTLQGKLDVFLGMLDRAVGPSGDYTLLAQGYCTGRPELYCSVDADCSAAGATTCNVATLGTYRCASPIGNVPCAADVDCTAVDGASYCLTDSTRSTTLHAVLVTFSDNSTDLDVGDILADLEEILDRSDVNLSDSTRMLDDGAESLGLFNTSDILILIREIESGIADFDTDSIREQMLDTQSSIDNVDFDGFIEQIEDNLDIYDRVANNTFIDTWIETFEMVKDFMFKDEFLKSYLANVESAVLVDILTTSGPAAALSHIGEQVDRTLDNFRRNQSGIDVQESNETYATKYVDIYDTLDKAGGSRYATTSYVQNDQHGALYFLLALGDNLTVGQWRTVPYNHPLARGVFANSEGYRYEDEDNDDDVDDNNSDDVYCFSLSCFEHTMSILNTAPLSEVSAEINPPTYSSQGDDSDDPLAGLNFSREELMFIMWVPVLLLLIIGLCTFGFALFPKFYKMHFRCNCCFLSCALLILPFIFIFSSIFFFAAIVGEDACISGTALGESYINAFGDEYCEQKLGGTGGLSDCTFNWTVPERFGENANITINLDVLDTYNAFFQKECGMSTDPFEKISLDLAEQIRPFPLKASQKTFDESDYELRPGLEDIVNNAASNYGQVMYDLIAETNFDGEHKVMSCESMSLIYADIQDTGCEGVVLPMVWLIGSWYVVAWAICCCGVPASCFTLVKTKIVNLDELDSSDEESSSGDDEESDEESVEEEGGGIQMQDVYMSPPEDFPSSDEDNHTLPSAPTYIAPATYTTIVRVDSSGASSAGARQMSGNVPRPAKESGNSYLDRSSGSAQSLGLEVNDSRFQTSRKSRRGTNI